MGVSRICREQLVLGLTKSALENYGYRVLTAANGLEAVAAFEARKAEVQLRVTDVEMPFLDGMTAVRSVRKMSPNLPIILATGSSRHGPEQFSQNDLAGIVRIAKPYNAEQLLTEVARALNST